MVEVEVLGVHPAEEHPYPLVLLRHENRILPILIGPDVASAIQLGLMKEKTPRPLTHDLICNLLAGLRADLQSVSVYSLQNDTFYAHLNVAQKNAQGEIEQILRIDSRASDAIAIAVRVGCPIYASDEVMEAAQDAIIGEDSDDGEGDEDDEEFGE